MQSACATNYDGNSIYFLINIEDKVGNQNMGYPTLTDLAKINNKNLYKVEVSGKKIIYIYI